MPSNWLYIDTNFPSFTQKENVNDKVETMQDYLFMLVEQLRYTLHNLDLSNMNKTATDEFVKQITDPIYGEIKDAEGNITQVALVAEGLAARIGDAEGNITQLQATAKGLQASVSNLDGAITNIKADVNGIRATVSTKIDATQAQSIFDQSATGFTLGATSGENGTIFELNYNGVQVASTGSVDLYVDAVNVYGTLTAERLQGSSIRILDDEGNRCGYIYSTYASSAETKIELDSDAIEIGGDEGSVFIGSVWDRSTRSYYASIEVDGNSNEVQIKGDVIPNADATYSLGSRNFVWDAIYCSTDTLNGSDRNIKNSIEALPEKYVRMFELVEPKRYKLNSGTSGRFHTGFIAQEVEAAMQKCGITSQEFAGWAAAKREDGSETYFLRYSEFIPILWAKVREQEERLKRLEESA